MEFIKKNYEKILLVLLLVGLLIQALILAKKASSIARDNIINPRSYSGKRAQPLDENKISESFKQVSKSIEWVGTNSFQGGDGTLQTNFVHRIFSPQPHVLREDRMFSPVTRLDWDGDRLPNHWETQFKLGMLNPKDGLTDVDADGFNNYEEYLAGTDPRNADQFPDPIAKLRLLKIYPKSFVLKFEKIVKMGEITRFSLQMPSGKIHSGLKLEDIREGYQLVDFRPKTNFVTNIETGKQNRQDVSELILKQVHDDTRLQLVFQKENPQTKMYADLEDRMNRKTNSLSRGESIPLKNKVYKLVDIDDVGNNIRLIEESTGSEHMLTPE